MPIGPVVAIYRWPRLKHEPPYIGEHAREESDEACAERAVDHAMIVRERQRQHEAWRKFLPVPYRFHRRLADAEDRDFGRVDDRREVRSADSAEARYRKAAALHVGRRDLAGSHALAHFAELARKLEQSLAIRFAKHRNDEAVRRVDRDADVVVLLHDEALAVG